MVERLKKYFISFVIALLLVQTSYISGLIKLDSVKASDPTTTTEIYATSYGGSVSTVNKSNVTNAPDDLFASVSSDQSNRYVYGKSYTNSLEGDITKVEIAVRYKVATPFVNDSIVMKYKKGSASVPDGATFFTETPTNTEFSTTYLDVTDDEENWTKDDIESLYVYAVNQVNGEEVDGNDLQIDALWVRVTTNYETDDVKPTSEITFPVENGFYKSIETISGTASDCESGIKKVEVKLYDNGSGKFFDGETFSSGEPVWFLAEGTENWLYYIDNSYFTSGKQYTVFSRATDNSDNVQDGYSSVSFYFDNVAPTGNIVINDGSDATNGEEYIFDDTEEINYPVVKLSLDYFDDYQGDENRYMRISNYPDMSNDPDGRNNGEYNTEHDGWTDFNGEVLPWYLTDGDGLKTVYVQFKDKAGNESEIFSSNIFYSHFSYGADVYDIETSPEDYLTINPFGNVEINLLSNSTTKLFASKYEQNPTYKNSGITFLNYYYDFSVADDEAIEFPVYIKIYFTDADLTQAGMTKDKLKGLYYFDFASSSWLLYSNSGVTMLNLGDEGFDEGYAGYVWAWAEHFTPMSIGGDITSPERPANFKATSGNEKVELKWDEVNDASGYYVRYRKSTSSDSTPYTAVYVSGKSNTTTTITGLTNGVEYEFGVASKDASDNLSAYAVVVATPNASHTSSSSSSTNSSYGTGNGFVGSANAAGNSSSNTSTSTVTENKNTDTNKDTSDDSSETTEDNSTNWTRIAVTLGILALALGAGFGGYYGYQWWVAGQERENEEKQNKKNKRSGRW